MLAVILRRRYRNKLNIITLCLFFSLALFGKAQAGDIADRQVWGFSDDGRFFAFEEYGIQDGSGFPYANIYFINTERNRWVKETPIRVLIQDETATLDEARSQAREQADTFFKDFNIKNRGKLLAHNPVTEVNRDPHSVTVSPGLAPFLKQYALTFDLKEFSVPTKRCKDYGDDSQTGYTLEVKQPNEAKLVLHQDTRIPTSRGCPRQYAISDIIQFKDKSRPKEVLYIVILQVFRYGFEGNDGRYLASGHWLPGFNATN